MWNWTTIESDAVWVRRALGDHPRAFEVMVLRYQRRAHAIARAVGVPAGSVEDVVQEAFLKAFENLPHLRQPESFGLWFLSIVRNAARRWHRESRWEALPLPEDLEAAGGDAVEKADLRETLWRKVAEMPEGIREAVFLYYHEGESARRTAAALGISLAAALKRLERGREILREKLWGEMDDRLRGSMPSSREWTRRARRLAILLIGTVGASWGATAAGAGFVGAAASANTALSKAALSPATLSLGGIGMAAVNAKKIGIGLSVLLLLLGSGLFIADPFHLRGGREAKIASAPTPDPAAADDEKPSPSRAPKAEAPEAEEPAPVEPFGSILARAVYEDDKEPVPGVLARGFGKGDGNLRTVTTDEKGEARFPRVPEGGFQVYLQRGNTTFAAKTIEVEAGLESELTLELPPGVQIDGIVVDGDGKPVPGASIWLTEAYSAFQGAVVAAAGDDGKFQMRHVELQRLIGARAPGFAPSVLRSIEGRPTSVLPIRIVLDQPAAAVEGVVVGPAGNPLPGAMVKIEKKAGGLMWTPDGIELRYAPLAARTDGEGTFAFDSVPVGDLTIAARSEGLVPFEEPIAVPEEGLAGVRIDLEEGATVVGTVRTPEGNVAWGTIVAVGPGESTEPYRSGDLASIATTVGQDGTYRLAGVKPGEFEVRADSRGKGKASARFTAQAGEEVRWDAQLTLGLEIFGRVVDENGQPVKQVLVGAEGKGCLHTWIWTDREGRFRFSNCNEVPHTVSTQLGDSPASVAQEEVRPGSGEVTVVIRPGDRPSAFITGKIVDPDGKPAETAQIVMHGLSTIYPEKDASFRIGPLPPGRHQFDVLLGEHPRIRRGCELTENETADLGTIQVHRGGRVQARLRKPDGTPCPCSVRIMNEAADLDVEAKCSPDGIVSSELAQPGDYFILIGWHRGLAATWIPVRIEDGLTASADVTILEGAERGFRLSSPEKPREPTRVIVRAANGAKVFDCPLWPDSGWNPSPDASGFVREFRVSFAPGTSYVVEALVRGRSASASFTVPDLAETADPIVLELR